MITFLKTNLLLVFMVASPKKKDRYDNSTLPYLTEKLPQKNSKQPHLMTTLPKKNSTQLPQITPSKTSLKKEYNQQTTDNEATQQFKFKKSILPHHIGKKIRKVSFETNSKEQLKVITPTTSILKNGSSFRNNVLKTTTTTIKEISFEKKHKRKQDLSINDSTISCSFQSNSTYSTSPISQTITKLN